MLVKVNIKICKIYDEIDKTIVDNLTIIEIVKE